MSNDTLLDRLLAAAALVVLTAFLSVLVWYVPQPGLTIVCIVVVALAAIDFYRMSFLGKN